MTEFESNSRGVHSMVVPAAARGGSRYVVVLAGLTIATFVVALLVAFHSRHVSGILDADGYASYGFRLADGQGLVDSAGRPTAFRGPVMPLVCALTSLVCGKSLAAVQIVLCGFYALANGLVGYLAWRYYRSLRLVVMTMVVGIGFWPAYPWFCHIFSEPVFTFLLAGFLLVWTETIRSGSRWGYAATGLLLAASSLCRPEMYVFVPVLLIDVLHKHSLRWKGGEALTLIAIGFLLLEAPWVVRNWVSVGKPVISADNGTMNIFLATWFQEANWQGNPFHDPDRFAPAGQGFWQRPEEERNRIFWEMALQNVREAPGQVLLCIPRRFFMFFYQYGPRGWLPSLKSLVFATTLYLSALIGYRRSSAAQKVLLRRALCLVGVIAAVHTAMVSEFRFSCPVQPYIILMAMAGALGIFDRMRGRGEQSKEQASKWPADTRRRETPVDAVPPLHS